MAQQREKEAEDGEMENCKEDVEDEAFHREARRKERERRRRYRDERHKQRAEEAPPEEEEEEEEATAATAAQVVITKQPLFGAVYNQHRERPLPPSCPTLPCPSVGQGGAVQGASTVQDSAR